jgi:hypothetical protein
MPVVLVPGRNENGAIIGTLFFFIFFEWTREGGLPGFTGTIWKTSAWLE